MNRVKNGVLSGLIACWLTLVMGASVEAGRDVALGPKGRLSGRAFSAAGQPLANVPVEVRSSNGAVVTMSDSQGAFAVENVGAGTIEVRTPQGRHKMRGWKEGTAPPAADKAAFLREERPGNRGGKGFQRRVERSGRDFTNHPSLWKPVSP